MKILLVAWNRLGNIKKGNWNHELFRRELARQHDVIFFGVGYDGYDKNLTVTDVINNNPGIDIVLTHFEHRDKALAKGLEDVRGVPMVHICGDYDPKTFRGYNYHFNKVKYDIIFGPMGQVVRDLNKNGIRGKHFLLPYAVDTNYFYDQHLEKTVDVMIAIQEHKNSTRHKNRQVLKSLVANMDGINSFIGNVWFEEYVKKINESKIFCTSNIAYKQLSGKYSEVLACGSFLLTTRPEDLEELGYKPGYHLVLYKDDFSDFEDKIRYFLKNENEREEIAKNGMEFVRKNHSSEIRVKQFIEIVEKELYGR